MFGSMIDEYVKKHQMASYEYVELYIKATFGEILEIMDFLDENEIFFENFSEMTENRLKEQFEFSMRIKTYNKDKKAILMMQTVETNGLKIKYPNADKFENITVEEALKYLEENTEKEEKE